MKLHAAQCGMRYNFGNSLLVVRRELARKIQVRGSHTTSKVVMAPNRPNELVNDSINDPIVDYDHFINDFSKRREPSVIRELNKLYSQKSDSISFAGGLPHPLTFPFQELSVRLTDGTNISLEGKPLQDSLQYIPSQGYPPLLEKLRKLQWKVHSPPQWENTDILITSGSQDGLCRCIEMCLEEGEPIIVQHPVYSGTESLLKPFKANIITVEQDENGLRPDLLRYELQSRYTPEETFSKKRGIPKLLYVNTTGANPTGVALSTERKKEIYRIVCEYNLIILEDDPYYYLHFQDKYPTSFLSLDTEGRVLRFDSFSKIISPGIRVGFVTGPKQLIKRIELHLQASSLHAAALSQVLIDKIMDNWGFDGLFKHFDFIQKFYKTKRDALIKSAEKHLTGLAEWNVPTAGMFLWIKVKGVPDTYNLVTKECLNQGVLFVSGHAYTVKYGEPCPYLRACYTLPTIQQMDVGMERLAEAIRQEQKRSKHLASAEIERMRQ
ncbi:UNVERIFIED_CONTAM: hypothetical protein PYX00_005976 [Menopon gallinae]|uniref:Aminotransferase class I/classII large domain-containing protein n=1 Tax=Menopon gallinae TaxID=328185 RepID=A0AAW2HVI7_9NEOP